MLIHVLHLPERKDRYENILKQQKDHNLEIVIHDGVKTSTSKIAINQGHKKIIQWAKETNLQEVLVAEDDFCLSSHGAFEYFMQNKPNDYDLYLGGVLQRVKGNQNQVTSFTGLHFYMIHHRFYSTFLSAHPQMDIDAALNGLGKYIICNPMVATQIPSFSDHHKSNKDYSKYLKGQSLFVG